METTLTRTPPKPRGTLSLFFRARCACGIWKDVPSANTYIEEAEMLAEEAFIACGWTNTGYEPICARCSEVAALNEELKARGRR